MGQAYNPIHLLISTLAFILSTGVFITAILLSRQATTQCDYFLDRRLIIMSSFLLAFSILGIFGAFHGMQWIHWLCGCVVVSIVTILMFALSLYAYVVAIKNPIKVKGHKHGNYESWLNNRASQANMHLSQMQLSLATDAIFACDRCIFTYDKCIFS
ncbi:tetraspanin-8-like [Impatiens glandulifera]|uniref:tetraspanin-8-like n=1 Tax=Impatiens glandulifera TaxID=253017 RepID=UPI001FB1072B|nr:tetraspanin-8-like [Impatiens glandulifera]